MKKINIKPLLPYLLTILGFIVIAYAYTPEVLRGKIVNQSDISSWRGMANEIITHNEANPDDPTLWTNSMFSGMPATSISVNYEGDYTDPVYKLLFTGARPASYLLISLIGGFLLFLAFGTNVYLAALGAIAITFCSYNMQIIQVGHNTKMVAIAFMPWVLASIVYAYRKQPLWGSVLFAFALSFQVKANHPQITYYLAIIILGFAIAQFCSAIKNKKLPKFFKTSAFLLVFGLMGIATNANHLIPTYEYAKYTMRGGSELSSDEELKTGDGLKLDYATAWSYGIEETPNLLIPNFNGGSSSGELSKKSDTYQVLKGKYQGADRLIKQMPLYWGPQPFTAGPMYLGAISIFLCVLGLILIKGKYKWWIVGVSILAVFLAWGSHFMWFSELFFKYAPLYNKFRTVSMILVVLQITIPIMGVLALHRILFEYNSASLDKKGKEKIKRGFLIALAVTGGFSLLFALFPSLAGNFVSPSDASFPADIANALVNDRKGLLRSDAFRSFAFICVSAGVLWLGFIKKIKSNLAVGILLVLIVFDFWGIDKRYLNKSHFIRQYEFKNQFAARPVDDIILQDKELDYRVLDLSVNTFNDAHTSFHHKTIGGYSPAKLQRYQDVIDHYISPEINSMIQDINSASSSAKSISDMEKNLKYYPILSMLNTKYIIVDGSAPPLQYPHALGNAWFVPEMVWAENADEEIALLGTINPQKCAVVDRYQFLNAGFSSISSGGKIEAESFVQSISLTHYAPNCLKYKYNTPIEAFAVFSEIYYPKGWVAKVDGKEVPIFKANYILRSVLLPSGEHEIEFRFTPNSFSVGKKISQASSIVLYILLLLAGAATVFYRTRRE